MADVNAFPLNDPVQKPGDDNAEGGVISKVGTRSETDPGTHRATSV